MSETRKDVRVKLDADLHRALKVLARRAAVTEAELVERWLVPHLYGLIHGTIETAAELTVAGLSGNRRDLPGQTGMRRDNPGQGGNR